MFTTTTTLKICHGEGVIEFLLGQSLWFPLGVYLFVFIAYFIKDIWLFLVGHFIYGGIFLLMKLIAEVLEIPRPLEIQDCDNSLALPDPFFVAAVSFVLIVGISWCYYRIPSWNNYFTILVVASIMIVYFIEIIRVGYLTLEHLLINLTISVFVALVTFFLIFLIYEDWIHQIAEIQLVKNFNYTNSLLDGNFGSKPELRKHRHENFIVPL